MTQSGERPKGVRIAHPDGSSTPCELAYAGKDDDGIHVWTVMTTFRPGDVMHIAVLPPHSRIDFPANLPLPPDWTPS